MLNTINPFANLTVAEMQQILKNLFYERDKRLRGVGQPKVKGVSHDNDQ